MKQSLTKHKFDQKVRLGELALLIVLTVVLVLLKSEYTQEAIVIIALQLGATGQGSSLVTSASTHKDSA